MEPSLDAEQLLLAYAQGFFPMPDPDVPERVLWYHPDPRAVLPLDGFHVSRSLEKRMKRGGFRVSFDTAFPQVMASCAAREDTWINGEFLRAYGDLHQRGFAHSVEVWNDAGALVGGAYGVRLGGAFFAESMFHRETDMSKVALHALVTRLRERGFALLEVQFLTPHLESLGAVTISRTEYLARLGAALKLRCVFS